MRTEGKLYFDGIEDTFCEEIALDIYEDPDNVKMTIIYLQKCGLLQLDEQEQEIELLKINEMVGSETNKAELMRKKRARDRLKNIQIAEDKGNNVTCVLPNVTPDSNNVTPMLPNVTATLPDVTKRYTDIDIEKDIDIE